MPSRNDITGDVQQTRYSSKLVKQLQEDGELMSVEERRKNKGSYVWDPGERRFVEKHLVQQKSGLDIHVNHFEPYVSMVTGDVIENKRQHLNDLHKTNSRVYEGREIEQQEADRHKAYKDKALWNNVGETLRKTAHDIEHGYLTPDEPIGRQKPETWDWR